MHSIHAARRTTPYYTQGESFQLLIMYSYKQTHKLLWFMDEMAVVLVFVRWSNNMSLHPLTHIGS